VNGWRFWRRNRIVVVSDPLPDGVKLPPGWTFRLLTKDQARQERDDAALAKRLAPYIRDELLKLARRNAS
jgi:hypothetical protein